MKLNKDFFRSARFAELIFCAALFCIGFVCSSVVRSTSELHRQKVIKTTIGDKAKKISLDPVEQFDLLKALFELEKDDKYFIAGQEIHLPDTFARHLPFFDQSNENTPDEQPCQ